MEQIIEILPKIEGFNIYYLLTIIILYGSYKIIMKVLELLNEKK